MGALLRDSLSDLSRCQNEWRCSILESSVISGVLESVKGCEQVALDTCRLRQGWRRRRGGLSSLVLKLAALAALFEHRLQERLGPRPAIHFDVQLLADFVGNLQGHFAAQARVQTVAALNEGFNQSEFVNGDARGIKGRQGLIDCGFRERAHAFQSGFMHDHGSCNEITEALVLLAEKNAEHADAVKARKGIHDAKKVAGNRVIGTDGTAIIFHYAQLDVALSGSLAIPHNLEEGEVCRIQEKTSDDEKRENPLLRGRSEQPESGKHDEEEDENKESYCALNSRIGGHG